MLYKYGFQHFVTNGNIQVTHFLVGSKKRHYLCIRFLKKIKMFLDIK